MKFAPGGTLLYLSLSLCPRLEGGRDLPRRLWPLYLSSLFDFPPKKKTFRRQMGAKNNSKKGGGGEEGLVLAASLLNLNSLISQIFSPRLLWFQEMGGDKKLRKGGRLLQFWLPPLRTCLEEVGNYTAMRAKVGFPKKQEGNFSNVSLTATLSRTNENWTHCFVLLN